MAAASLTWKPLPRVRLCFAILKWTLMTPFEIQQRRTATLAPETLAA
jgi:hypothetical protein